MALQRHILGAIAVVSFCGAAMAWAVPSAEGTLSIFTRLGILAAAAWLAYDNIQRLPTWVLLMLPVLLYVIVRWPKLFLLLIPALILVAVLQRIFLRLKG